MVDKLAHQKLCESYKGVAESLARASAGRGVDQGSFAKLATKIAGLADREIRQVTDGGLVPLACSAGCNACCQVMPTGAAAEAARILGVIQRWPDRDRMALLARLDEYVAAAESHRNQGFLRFRKACPLLVDGLCSIYEARPLFCRGLSSEDPVLCAQFNADAGSEDTFGPNGELGLAQAMIEGLVEGSAPPGTAKRVEIPRALWEVLTNRIRLQDLLQAPSLLQREVSKDWVRRFESDANDPLAVPISDPSYWEFLEQRRGRPIQEILHWVAAPTTANSLAKITMPSVFHDPLEMEEHWGNFKTAIDDALTLESWNPQEAFNALANFRPISAAYQPHSLTASMEKIGRLLHDRIAEPIAPELLEPLGPRKPGRIRVALLGDIANKSGANWALGWVKGLNRDDFEVTVLKTQGTEDGMSFRFKDHADHYYRLLGHTLEAAKFVRSLDLDYLIYPDLGDNGAHYRFAMFRLARRQATAWGCPFTSGLPTIDDYLSSDLMEIPDADRDYTEELVRLLHTGLTLDPPAAPKLNATRQRFGLPEGFLVSFPQYLIKWLPESDHLLAEISARVANPIVFFDQGLVEYEREVFQRRLDRLGVKSMWIPQTRNLSTFRAMMGLFDVTLDSPGWSGGLTGLHCLSVGTPIITLPGRFLRQRLATAFSLQAGANGCVARDESDYIDLATSADRLRELSARIEPERLWGDVAPLRALEDHIRQTRL